MPGKKIIMFILGALCGKECSKRVLKSTWWQVEGSGVLFGRDDYGNERVSYVGRVCLMLAVIVAMVPMVVPSRWSGPSPALSTRPDRHSLTHCRRDVGKGPVSDYQLLTIISCTIRVLASTAFVTAVPHLVILTEVTDNYEFASCWLDKSPQEVPGSSLGYTPPGHLL